MIRETQLQAKYYHAVTYAEGLLLFHQLNPDAVVLDMNMPGLRSIELLQQIRKKNGPTATIALVNKEDHKMHNHCLSNGAHYSFDKYHDYEKIPAALLNIANANLAANCNN